MKRIFKKKERAEPVEELSPEVDSNLLRAFLNNEPVDRDKAVNVPSIAGALLKIADKAAGIPIKLYKRAGDHVEEVEDERVRLLNYETGDTLNAYEMKHAMIVDYFLGKGGYAYINKEGNKVKSLHYVKESDISFEKNTDVIFKDYKILVQGKRYDPWNFVRILRNTEDGMKGRSIVDENSKLLSVAYHSLKFEENLVSTGGNKKGFIKSAKRLTKEAMEKLKQAWRKLYSNNTENVVILNDGLDFKEASNTSVEMQLNENKKTNAVEACKIIGIPPAMIEGKATEQDEKIFIKYAVDNILKVLETAINCSLLKESEKNEYYFEADTSELNRSDIEKRYAAYGVGLDKGFLQADEVREKEKMRPLGLKFVKVGLQDALLNPESGDIYVLNTKEAINLNQLNKGGDTDES